MLLKITYRALCTVIVHVPPLDVFLSFGTCEDAGNPCRLRHEHAYHKCTARLDKMKSIQNLYRSYRLPVQTFQTIGMNFPGRLVMGHVCDKVQVHQMIPNR